MRSLIIWAFVFVIASNAASAADEPIGRYQAVPLARSANDAGDRVMILDTSTGDLWQWWDAPGIGKYPPRTGITYMGKVSPGGAAGETTTFKRFDKTEKPDPLGIR